MFGKKASPEPQQAQYPVLVLTPDYLIEGMTAPVKNLHFTIFTSGDGYGSIQSTMITDAHFQPIGPHDSPSRDAQTFMAHGDQIIAQIPKTGAPINTYDYWKEHKKPLAGTFYIGPFLFTGTMMLLNDEIMDLHMPMVDVTISSARSGDKFGGISAPFAIVNTFWMIGYEPL